MTRHHSDTAAVDAVVTAALDVALASGTASSSSLRVAVGFSGGRDSMLLVDTVARVAIGRPVAVRAVHVHHGLSPQADAWASFCAAAAAKRAIPLDTTHVTVARRGGQSLEAAAREARLGVLLRTPADLLLLAHHADDQAETLLLQLLRGAGPHGLAAMPAARAVAGGPTVLRPFLGLPRQVLEAAALARGLDWIDDESNEDTRFRRNYLRHLVLPAIARGFPGYPATLVRAAAHQAEAAQLADDLAAIDAAGALAEDAVDGTTLDRRRLASLASTVPHRARNLLRWFLRDHGLRPPSTRRLEAMLAQLSTAAGDARLRIDHDGLAIGIHRGRIHVHAAPPCWTLQHWHGEPALELPHGRLLFEVGAGSGVDGAFAARLRLEIRPRQGGERVRTDPGQPAQSVANVLQQRGVPHWRRGNWPLFWRGGATIGIADGAPGTVLRFDAGDPVLYVRWLEAPGGVR